jgi:hypothetical protein
MLFAFRSTGKNKAQDSLLKKEIICSSEMLVPSYHTVRYHHPDIHSTNLCGSSSHKYYKSLVDANQDLLPLSIVTAMVITNKTYFFIRCIPERRKQNTAQNSACYWSSHSVPKHFQTLRIAFHKTLLPSVGVVCISTGLFNIKDIH